MKEYNRKSLLPILCPYILDPFNSIIDPSHTGTTDGAGVCGGTGGSGGSTAMGRDWSLGCGHTHTSSQVSYQVNNFDVTYGKGFWKMFDYNYNTIITSVQDSIVFILVVLISCCRCIGRFFLLLRHKTRVIPSPPIKPLDRRAAVKSGREHQMFLGQGNSPGTVEWSLIPQGVVPCL